MVKSLKYHFLLLFKNTHYFETCIILLLFSFILTILPITNGNKDAFSLGQYQIFSFITNQSNRTLYASLLLLAPLFCSVPVTQIMISQRNSESMILSRTKKIYHWASLMIVSFFCGFSLIMIVNLSSLLFSCLLLKSDIQDMYYTVSIFIPNNTYLTQMCVPLYNWFLTDPLQWSLFYMILIGIFGGLFSQITAVSSFFISKKAVNYFFTFLIFFINALMTSFIPSLLSVLDPYLVMSGSKQMICIFIYFILIVVCINVASLIYLKKDVYS